MQDDLTTQQKSRVRRAFRETFEAKDRFRAVAVFYERFTELYGVTVEELWSLVAVDRAKQEEQSVQAEREELGSSSASIGAAKGKQPETPSKHLRRKPSRGGKVSCPACGRSVGRTSLSQHKSPNRHYWCNGVEVPKPEREKRTCRKCRKSYSVRQTDGRMVSHKGKDGKKCDGSGRAPFEGRGYQYMHVAPAVVIGGGLPGLGRKR